ncbi:MAG: hypothetical protein MUO63_13900 [Desulfobulbaceae bacterium]|nr:hypothetical protein [Desulfobulbaceae bacterium]
MINGAEKIQELKAAILAIEWEITDEAMDSLTRAIEPLQAQWAGKKPLLVCLQVIGTLGKYIKKAREKAHLDAIKLLPDVFATLETVITDESMDDGRKIALVRGAVEKYNRLKAEVAKPRKEPVRKSPPVAVAEKPGVEAPPVPGQGGSTIRDLMEQKEDQAVDGAFNVIFQEMVSADRGGAKAAAPAMPSVGGLAGPDAKEVVLARVDDEEFPEADSLLDDFFSEDGLAFSLGEESVEQVSPAADETVEVDIGQIEAKKEKIAEPELSVERIEEEEIIVDKLDRIIQNMQYGISAALLSQLAAEIDSLRSQYPNYNSVSLFLEVIGAVGRHLDSHGDVAVDLSRNMLQTVYDRLAHSLFTLQPQKNLLPSHLETVHDYIKWHEQVMAELEQQRAAAVAEQPAQVSAEAEGEMPAEMVAAVKSIVRQEVDELRKELLELIENR